jgi:hypothetical protein
VAANFFSNWLNQMVVMALVQLQERHRWQCLLDRVVRLRGDNGLREDVAYTDVPGHRVTAATDWTLDTEDPWIEIFDHVNFLRAKGLIVTDITTSTAVMETLRMNPATAKRAGRVILFNQTSGESYANTVDMDDVQGIFAANQLPVPQVHDAHYFDADGTTRRFFDEGSMHFRCRTGNDRDVFLPDDPTQRRMLEDTLGYYAIGRPANRSTSGRAVDFTFTTGKSASIAAEAWQTGLPVLENAEADGSIDGITLYSSTT